MIVFDLICPKGHGFESWFKDSAAFETQASKGLIVCPTCGSKKIKKALMAPNLAGVNKNDDAPAPPSPLPLSNMTKKAALEVEKATELRENLRKTRKTIEENFDYVGGEFAEEARKIHYGEAEARNIYGETSDEEAKALTDEGVELSRIPWIQREDS